MAETTAFLKCSECGAAFAPSAPNQLTCSPECGDSRHAVKKAERRVKRLATLAARPVPCALPGCAGTFARRHNNHKYCSPACAKRAETLRHRGQQAPPAPSPKLLTVGEMAALLPTLVTRRDLDDFHREAAIVWCMTTDRRAQKRIRALAIEARERMQAL